MVALSLTFRRSDTNGHDISRGEWLFAPTLFPIPCSLFPIPYPSPQRLTLRGRFAEHSGTDSNLRGAVN